jgi:tRNA uridine 5-carbamoylmethylation protein Kti12
MKIIILNGTGRSGKDEFVNQLENFVAVKRYSTIDKIKDIAIQSFGWNGEKDNKGRNKFNKLISKTRQPSRIVSPTLSYNKNNRSINNNTMKINNCTVHTISKINMIKKGPIKAKK